MCATFKRHDAQPAQAKALDLLASLTGDSETELTALSPEKLAAILDSARTPIRVHGRRTEEMFVYIAVALGGSRVIKREDAGELVLDGDLDVTVPDFRMILADGKEILVEVKNSNRKSPSKSRAMSGDYLRRILRYGELFKLPVYLAVYWSQWRWWTLHSVERMLSALQDDRVRLSFMSAIPRSEMRLLGDVTLGSRYPIALRFGVSSKRLSGDGTQSEHLITIESVDMSVAGKPIKGDRERAIAFGFMMNGRWEESENLVMEGDQISAIEYTYSPAGPDPSVDFAMVASLSTLASGEFNSLTAGDKGVERIRAASLPAPPYPRMGEEYRSKELPIWRFILQPGKGWAAKENSPKKRPPTATRAEQVVLEPTPSPQEQGSQNDEKDR